MDEVYLPGLYIHIPFCVRKCNYCDFFSVGKKECVSLYGENVFRDLIDSECNQIRQLASCPDGTYEGLIIPKRFDSIYIGGGTPSMIDPSCIYELLNCVHSHFSIESGSEITLEANPGTLDYNKLSEYRRAGINRLSIGVQSLDDGLLNFLGRIHTAEEARRTVDIALEQFQNVNIDFIFGIPGLKNRSDTQTLDQARKCASFAASLGVPHVSFYSLIKEPGTKMYKWDEENKLVDVDELDERTMYYDIIDILKDRGYVHYEISNFALPGKECAHNLKYWSGAQYLGIGPGAVSFLQSGLNGDHVRFKALPDIGKYINNFSTDPRCNSVFNGDMYEIQERLGINDRKKEFLMLGFRKITGPDPGQYSVLFGGDSLFTDFKSELGELLAGQYINEDLSLTRRGLDMANEIFMKFI